RKLTATRRGRGRWRVRPPAATLAPCIPFGGFPVQWRRAITSLSAAVALMVAGLVGASAAHAAPSFSDVPPGEPFHAEIAGLASEGITTGYADGTFRPYDAINRDAMAAFMYRLAGEPAFAP